MKLRRKRGRSLCCASSPIKNIFRREKVPILPYYTTTLRHYDTTTLLHYSTTTLLHYYCYYYYYYTTTLLHYYTTTQVILIPLRNAKLNPRQTSSTFLVFEFGGWCNLTNSHDRTTQPPPPHLPHPPFLELSAHL